MGGLVLGGFGAYEGAYAAGWAGTHGKLTVESCDVVHTRHGSSSGRKNRGRTVRCHGTFVSDDGKTKDVNATLESKRDYLQKTQVSVQQTDFGTIDLDTDASYVVSGWDRALRWFAGFFGAWILIGLGVFCLATGYAPFGRSRIGFNAAWEAAGRNVTRAAVIGMMGVGLVGAVLSFLISLFF
ncbi:hypothetical protein P8605_02130 [Streptomyces sp. T-3]|nr:hypothetical protein [Streptomyces sp. T-3]